MAMLRGPTGRANGLDAGSRTAGGWKTLSVWQDDRSDSHRPQLRGPGEGMARAIRENLGAVSPRMHGASLLAGAPAGTRIGTPFDLLESRRSRAEPGAADVTANVKAPAAKESGIVG